MTPSPIAGAAAGSVTRPCRLSPPSASTRARRVDGLELGEPALDRVRDADEVGDEPVHRALVELDRVALLLDPAVAHDHDDVAHRERLLLVVGHVDERDPDLALEGLELELHLLAQLEVERAERLVEEEHGRAVDERPGERDPLLLAARHLPGPAPLVAGEPDEPERLAHPAALLVALDPLLAEAVADVLGDVHVREQRVVLEDRVDVAPVGRDAGDRLALEEDLARRRLLEPGDHPERRRLAAARRPEEAVELAAGDLEGHLVDRDDVPEPLRHVEDLDVGGASGDRGGHAVDGGRRGGRRGRRRRGVDRVAAGHGCGQRRPRGWASDDSGTLHPPRAGQRIVRACDRSVKDVPCAGACRSGDDPCGPAIARPGGP